MLVDLGCVCYLQFHAMLDTSYATHAGGSGNAVTTVTETGAATAGPVGAVAVKLRTYSQPFAVRPLATSTPKDSQ